MLGAVCMMGDPSPILLWEQARQHLPLPDVTHVLGYWP